MSSKNTSKKALGAVTISGLMITTLAMGAAGAHAAEVDGTPENPITTEDLGFEATSISLERIPQIVIAGEPTPITVVAYNESFTQGAVLDPSTYVVRTNNDEDEIDGNVITFAADESGEIADREISVVYERGLGTTWTVPVAPDAESAVGVGVTIEFNDETTHGYAPPMAPGDTFTVDAVGPFFFGEDVDIYLNDEVIGQTVVDSDGQIRGAEVTIPEDTPAGNHELRLVGVDSGLESVVGIETFDLELWVDAEDITPGQDFAVRGSGFYANENISFEMIGDFPDGDYRVETTTNENGVFELMYNIPTQTEPGRYVARAVGEDSGRSSTIGFIVTDAGLEIIDPEDLEDVEIDGFDALSAEIDAEVTDGDTVDISVSALLDEEEVDIDFSASDFTVDTGNDDDEVDGLSVTFNGEGEREITVTHSATGISTQLSTTVVESDVELTEVTPEAPTRDGNVISVPSVEGVTYFIVEGEDVSGEEIDLDELGVSGVVIHTATEEGFTFSDDTDVTDWVFERITDSDDEDDDEDEGDVVEVSPAAPTQEGDTVTIPETEGVVYTVDGDAVEGEIVLENGESIVVEAQLVEGYEFAEDAEVSWNFSYEVDEDGAYDINVEVAYPNDRTSGVAPGEEIGVVATGFEAGEEVSINMNPELGVVEADSDGNIDTNVLIPEDTERGNYVLTLEGEESGAEGSAGVVVSLFPEGAVVNDVSLNPRDGGTYEHVVTDNRTGDDVSDQFIAVSDNEDDVVDGTTITYEGEGERFLYFEHVDHDDIRTEGNNVTVVAADSDEEEETVNVPGGDTDRDDEGAGVIAPPAESGPQFVDDSEETVVAPERGTTTTDRGASERGTFDSDSGEGEEAIIASGYVAENPGVAAGLLALVLGGLTAVAFGAQRLLRRTS